MSPSITHATIDKCMALATFAGHSFSDTFGHLYTAANLATHLRETCSAAYFRKALAAGDEVLLLQEHGQLIGYGKVGALHLPVVDAPVGAMEIHRCYIDRAHQGRGLGTLLLQHLLALPILRAAPALYLSVWENNLRAQAFYGTFGFAPVGEYRYQVGTQFDRELIFARLHNA